MKIYAASKLAKPLDYIHFSYISAQEQPREVVLVTTTNTVQGINEVLESCRPAVDVDRGSKNLISTQHCRSNYSGYSFSAKPILSVAQR